MARIWTVFVQTIYPNGEGGAPDMEYTAPKLRDAMNDAASWIENVMEKDLEYEVTVSSHGEPTAAQEAGE